MGQCPAGPDAPTLATNQFWHSDCHVNMTRQIIWGSIAAPLHKMFGHDEGPMYQVAPVESLVFYIHGIRLYELHCNFGGIMTALETG